MVSNDGRADRDASQYRTILAARIEQVEALIEKLEKRVEDLGEKQVTIHAENKDTFAEIRIKMAVMHYKIGLIFAIATALMTLGGGIVLKKLGLM